MVTIITTFQNEEIVKKYKVSKDIFTENYRILVDVPTYGKKNSPIVGADGKSDRLFRTRELAVEYVLGQVDKHMAFGIVDKYTMEYIAE